MKKVIVVLSICFLTMLICLTCFKDKPIVEEPIEKKIYYAYGMDYKSNTFYDEILMAFEEEVTNTQIHLVKYTPDQYEDNLHLKLLADEKIDVFQLNQSWIGSYESKSLITDESPLIESTYVLVYNKNLFQSLGLPVDMSTMDMERMVTYAEMISDEKKGFNIYGYGLPLNKPRQIFQEYLIWPYISYGYDFHGEFNLYAPWFKAIGRLQASNSLYPGYTALTKEKVLHEFATGSIAMLTVDTFDLYLIEQYMPDFELGICSLPAFLEEDILEEMKWSDFYIGTSQQEEKSSLFTYFFSETSKEILTAHGLEHINESEDNNNLIIDPLLDDLLLQLLDGQYKNEEQAMKQLNDYYQSLNNVTK